MAFYPNRCGRCYVTTSLKRCNGCHMVSYCGEPHQKAQWPEHKRFCKVISTMLKTKKSSHLFVYLSGVSRQKWGTEITMLAMELKSIFNAVLSPLEERMLYFPRVCFVCFEARQELLKNCPNCPFASFCKSHPKSPVHDKDCPEIKKIHDQKYQFMPVTGLIETLLDFAISNKCGDPPPTSMENLMEATFVSENNKNLNSMYWFSEIMSFPLTIYGALKMMNQTNKSELVIYMQGKPGIDLQCSKHWETLLHILPNLNSLTIVYMTGHPVFKTVKLCAYCLIHKKQLIIENTLTRSLKDVKEKSNKEPSLYAIFETDVIIYGIDHFINWHRNMEYWTKLSCPIVVACKEYKSKFFVDNLEPYFRKSRFYYKGKNKFAQFYPSVDWHDWILCKKFSYLVVASSPSESGKNLQLSPGCVRNETEISKDTSLEKNQEEDCEEDLEDIEIYNRLWERYFYHKVCYVCKATSSVICKKCKMIYYCGENHQKLHWPRHKIICKAVLSMLNETGGTTVFDKLKNVDKKLLMNAKLVVITNVEFRIGRLLTDRERELFWYPRVCSTCHESNSSVLKDCCCGLSFCKVHAKSPSHNKLCAQYQLSQFLTLLPQEFVLKHTVIVAPKRSAEFPLSMKQFLENFLNANFKSSCDVPTIKNYLLSEHLSRPLTFVYCAEYWIDPCYFENDSIVVHVIGSTFQEKADAKYWKFVLFWFHYLQKLTVVFIGPEVETETPRTFKTVLRAQFEFPQSHYLKYQEFEVKSFLGKYEDYYQSEEFIEPTVVIGFNLNMHQSDSETWKETVSVLVEANVPFIMTSKGEDRSHKDAIAFEKLLPPNFGYSYGCDENPFASLIPEREIESENLCYSNMRIPVHSTFYEQIRSTNKNKGKTLDELAEEMEEIQEKVKEMWVKSEEGKADRAIRKAKRRSGQIAQKTEDKSKTKLETEAKEEKPKPDEETDSDCIKHSQMAYDAILRHYENFGKRKEIVKENFYLKEENENLKKVNSELKQEYERLQRENGIIKNIRQQVEEGIREEMKKNSYPL